MALPETNISTSLIRSTIGESTNNVSELRTSPNNNWWGFSSSSRGWGNETPTPPYKMGDYRGYEYAWRTWAMEDFINTSSHFEDGSYMDLSIFWFPSWSTADGTDHNFKVEFKRTNDYHQGDGTTITPSITFNNETQKQVGFFNNSTPPDGGSALDEGDVVYIRVTRLFSEDRRWDSNRDLFPETNSSEYVFPYTISDKGWTSHTVLYEAVTTSWLSPSKTASSTITVNADHQTAITVNWETDVSLSPSYDFANEKITGSFQVTPQTTPGGGAILTSDIDSTETFLYSLNDTLYWRTRITSVSSGTFSSSYIQGTTVVTQTPPL